MSTSNAIKHSAESPPVDLSNLRDMTEGDTNLEQYLFREFISAGASCLTRLATSQTDGLESEWRSASHAFKGIAYNLGAQHLGDLCKQGQESQHAPEGEKAALYEQIAKAYEAVKLFLEGELA